MTKAQFRESIKREARVTNAVNLDTLIDEIADECLLMHVQKNFYRQLLTVQTIALVHQQSPYTLPANFIKEESISYGLDQTQTSDYPLKELRKTSRIRMVGTPRYYQILGDNIYLSPWDGILIGHGFRLNYYRNPLIADYVADEDDFPLEKIRPTIKQAVLARIARFHKDDKGEMSHRSDSGSHLNAALTTENG